MATKGIALRKWSLSASDYENEAEFRAAVQNELASFEHIGERLGIGVIAAPIRTRALPEGEWFTAGWVFQTATVPAAREASEIEALEDALQTVPDDADDESAAA
jgi:hypothetical protein